MIRAARLRWVHLLLGGALSMPYFMLVSVFVSMAFPGADTFTHLGWQFAAYAMELPLVAVTGLLFPLVRQLEGAAARSLCALPADVLPAAGPGRSRPERVRTAAWFTAHVGLGALVSGLTLAVPPMCVVLLGLPFVGTWREPVGEILPFGIPPWTAPLAGLALFAALAAVAAGTGALLARWAPPLLGPTPADLLAAARARAEELARRNELARELHDSVGHALSAVTLQASAARKVLDRDPEFAREALKAIEETTRDAVAELDAVLGVLRHDDEPPARAPAPTLAADLGALLARTRAAGAAVDAEVGADLGALPGPVAREAYRMVQEGLGNALRHAGPADVTLRIAAEEDVLRITVTNPLPNRPSPRASGGRGLRGIGERARLLGGTAESGPYEGRWRLAVELPL
ncbi:histidine kinase [Streptomyces sp. NPDC051940]|uniref:sensor histidine kinase n=1 Tax=Streptomyces sp. NPDC051940 TaxID=3155675 RepID=UPI0034175212